MDLYDFSQALVYYNKSLEIRKQVLKSNDPNIAHSYNGIGIVYKNLGNYDLALDYYKKGLDIYLEYFDDNNNTLPMSYSNIGTIFMNKGDFAEANKYYMLSLNLCKKIFGFNHRDVSSVYSVLGDLSFKEQDYDMALVSYHKGIISALQNNTDTADVSVIPPLSNYISYSFLMSSLSQKVQLLAGYFPLHDAKIEQNRYNITIEHIKAFDNIIDLIRKGFSTNADKIKLGEYSNIAYLSALEIMSDNPDFDHELAFYFSERNKASVLLEALAGAEALKFAGIPDSLLEIEHNLRIDITNYRTHKISAENDSVMNFWNDKLFNANRKYDSLISLFETNYPAYYNLKYNNSPVTLSETQRLLDKKTTMLSYSMNDTNIFIYAVSNNDNILLKYPKPDSLTYKIDLYRTCVSDYSYIVYDYNNNTHLTVVIYQKLANEFYKTLFPDEIIDFLKKNKAKNLLIIPDGELSKISFESLLTEKYNAEWTNWQSTTYFSEMPFLIKDYNITYSYSATLFKQTKMKVQSDSLIIEPLNDWIGFAPVFDDLKISGTTLKSQKLLS